MTLAEFLTARLDEDEAAALACTDCDGWTWTCDRMLAEAEAKRQIVAIGPSECGDYKRYPGEHFPAEQAYPCDGCSAARSYDASRTEILRMLAQPYADHPDFDPEWRMVDRHMNSLEAKLAAEYAEEIGANMSPAERRERALRLARD